MFFLVSQPKHNYVVTTKTNGLVETVMLSIRVLLSTHNLLSTLDDCLNHLIRKSHTFALILLFGLTVTSMQD